MLKTQITGAKYLSPQTNQMTNLNIAVPADSKDTEFGTSDILLAKDVAAYYYTKEETDNLILIAKNSAINIHNEDNTRFIKLDVDDTEAASDYGSYVNASLTDLDNDYSININTADGFRHSDCNGCYSNLHSTALDINNGDYRASVNSDSIFMVNDSIGGSIEMTVNKELTLDEQDDGYSPVDLSLTDGDYEADINAKNGLRHETNDGYACNLNCHGLYMGDRNHNVQIYPDLITLFAGADDFISLNVFDELSRITIGSDTEFTISRPADNTEGATITGVKSLTAFANPSATKVWATDGSTADLTTKANTSDVLLKKSASGGYYIEENSNELGLGAFATSSYCTASGMFAHAEGAATASGMGAHAEGQATASGMMAHAEGQATASGMMAHAEGYDTTASGDRAHAEGYGTKASGDRAHAEGYGTKASGDNSHAEGNNTLASGYYSHAEGETTIASGYCSHAQGSNNIEDKNAIYSVGIGNNTTRKNAEYIYAKNIEDGSSLVDDPKNGYKYLIGVGGYDGISTDNSTYKSVQEVIADLTTRIERLETKVRALEAANTPA